MSWNANARGALSKGGFYAISTPLDESPPLVHPLIRTSTFVLVTPNPNSYLHNAKSGFSVDAIIILQAVGPLDWGPETVKSPG
jgi:hypothetical protein